MCWDHEGHGSLDFIGALQHSCDVYFYQIGPKLGLDRLQAAAHQLGLGEKTGIDLPQEKRGLIPDAEWYDSRWGVGKWRKGMMLNLAIGQGELLVTPLQLATMVAEVAGSGFALRPHVVEQIRGVEGFKPARPTRGRFAAEDGTWAAVHTAMELVVQDGTAAQARVPDVRVAGKTGTAQNPHGKDHALFVCYAPAEKPTIAMAFVVENSGHGSSFAAPKAGAVLRAMFAPDTTAASPAPVVATGEASGD
jgi:penicillin-binding protein 2